MAAVFGLGGCVTARNAQSVPKPGIIRIAHCGDPQFGFGEGKEKAYAQDLARFERVIEMINREKPDLAFIAGDMVNVAADMERDWPRLLKLFEVPVVGTPGNHDMGNNLTKENVERFERVFGYEYKSLKLGKWRFISGNSQYWRPTNETARQEKYEAWISAELDRAKAAGEPIILATHIPPFVSEINEKDSYENYPKAGRAARFRRYVASGVKFYLSGHTHRLVVRARDGITILNPETTCRNFDQLPFGFRMFKLADDGSYSWDFVRVG